MAAPLNQDQSSEARIVESWHANAQPWVSAVRSGQIASRQLATDAAIIDAVLSQSPALVLDIGCGEGWLARAARASQNTVQTWQRLIKSRLWKYCRARLYSSCSFIPRL
jgi:2-polyprenyl-3-methyl-5-hydroxy-6-metoxy-1,4-benzoquinol methylase